MLHKHLRTCAALLLTMVCASVVSGKELRKDGFSISVPGGWVEIPRDVIDAFEAEMKKTAPSAPAQHYDYGFQLDASNGWFSYPYILVQLIHTGRIPESQLEKMEGYSIQGSLDTQTKAFDSIMSGIQVGKMVYDRQRKMIWMRLESDVAGVGPIAGISGMVPTEKGLIQVVGYSHRQTYPTYETAFRSVAASVSPEPGLAYEPKWSDSLPPAITGIDWGEVAGRGLAGGIVGCLIALIARRKRKAE